MARVKGKVKANVSKQPVKAGSTQKSHGGLPTKKIIKITANVKKNG